MNVFIRRRTRQKLNKLCEIKLIVLLLYCVTLRWWQYRLQLIALNRASAQNASGRQSYWTAGRDRRSAVLFGRTRLLSLAALQRVASWRVHNHVSSGRRRRHAIREHFDVLRWRCPARLKAAGRGGACPPVVGLREQSPTFSELWGGCRLRCRRMEFYVWPNTIWGCVPHPVGGSHTTAWPASC